VCALVVQAAAVGVQGVFGSSLLTITCQIDLQFPADPGPDFSRGYGTQKCALVPEGCIGCKQGKGSASGALVLDA
jgi:hypothetical protein